jgi:hypothetical protein
MRGNATFHAIAQISAMPVAANIRAVICQTPTPICIWRLTIELSGLPRLDCRAWLHHSRGGQVRPAAIGGRSNELLDTGASQLASLFYEQNPCELNNGMALTKPKVTRLAGNDSAFGGDVQVVQAKGLPTDRSGAAEKRVDRRVFVLSRPDANHVCVRAVLILDE